MQEIFNHCSAAQLEPPRPDSGAHVLPACAVRGRCRDAGAEQPPPVESDYYLLFLPSEAFIQQASGNTVRKQLLITNG